MQDTDWDDLRYFLAVARAESLSGAAKYLNVNYSTVLRRLGRLENRLRVRLFERLPSGYVMTPAGEILREQLRGVGDRIEAAQRQLTGLDLRLSGTIRLTSTDTLMHDLLMPHLVEFRKAHPGIQIQLAINNNFLSLSKREADVAVRPSNKPPEHLIGQRVGRIQTAVYASKTYLKRFTKRLSTEEPDWTDFDWVAPDEELAYLAQTKWMRQHVPEENIAMRVNSLAGMVEAVRHDMGVGLLLCLLAKPTRELVRVTEPIPKLDTQVWILTHPDLKSVTRVKALTDFLYARLTDSEFLIRNEQPTSAATPKRRMTK
ncbi:LysR family transcriptional regulator [Fischerella sp. PCC 9605]|uniref:LysR family transcriptional regulator n=1 Tax=Fischerella sp. PCC 9605 TaxID=1173024 RepID=UPI0004B19E29|nr:LysR family transcriptional regulator [Fischerella sp. PCC 9605]